MSFHFQDYPLGHRSVPDAPESVKHWSGYDPSDPPESEPDYACDLCGREMHGITETGVCFVCEAEFLAAHLIEWTPKIPESFSDWISTPTKEIK